MVEPICFFKFHPHIGADPKSIIFWCLTIFPLQSDMVVVDRSKKTFPIPPHIGAKNKFILLLRLSAHTSEHSDIMEVEIKIVKYPHRVPNKQGGEKYTARITYFSVTIQIFQKKMIISPTQVPKNV